MARNATIAVAEGAWTQLTAGDVTAITFQNLGPGAVEIMATVGATPPSDFSGAIRYQSGEGEIATDLVDLAPGIAATRVYAWATGPAAKVTVSHA